MSLHLAASLALISVVLWRLFRRFVVKLPGLDIAGPPSASWWSGNFLQIFNSNAWDFHAQLANRYGTAVRITGLFGVQQLYTFDPLALQYICSKNQHIYEEPETFLTSNRMVFGPNILSSAGDHHKRQRKMMTPVFALKHIRELMHVFYPIVYKLRELLSSEVIKNGGQDINLMIWMSRVALECVGQGGLGYSFDALDETKVNKYNEIIKMLSPHTMSLMTLREMLPIIDKLGPGWIRRKFLDWSPSRRLRQIGEIVDTMEEMARDIIHKRKEAISLGEEEVAKGVGQGRDIISTLLKANATSNESDRLTEEEVIGNMNVFVFAGHDTTTGALTRIFHQLVLHPEAQSRLRDEITEAHARLGIDSDLDYETLIDLPYLDAVIRETLRLFPPAPTAFRTSLEDTSLPLMWPVKAADGKHDVNVIPLKKGTDIIISVMHANTSPLIWGPDAYEWKPERWLSPLPESVVRSNIPGVYSSIMTFLGGGRSCIGFKFAEMEIKLILAVLLESFIFSPGSKDITWYMNAIASPAVKGSEDASPRLPLNISFVKEK